MKLKLYATKAGLHRCYLSEVVLTSDGYDVRMSDLLAKIYPLWVQTDFDWQYFLLQVAMVRSILSVEKDVNLYRSHLSC